MVLRTLLIPKGHKKEMKRKKTSQHKSRKGGEERVPDNSMKFFDVFFELDELSIYY
jgi:hypothetical protein